MISPLLNIFPGDVYKSLQTGQRAFVLKVGDQAVVTLRPMVPLHVKAPDVVIHAQDLAGRYELVETNPAARYPRNSGGGGLSPSMISDSEAMRLFQLCKEE